MLGYKEAIILRRLYLAGIKKGVLDLPKQVVGTIKQFTEQLTDTGFNANYIKNVLYGLEKGGILEREGGDLYKINEQKLLQKLCADGLFNLDQQIIEINYILLHR